ncbi:MAG TPA: mucoidy inhibitor MuiA family protein [Leptospiraceae bacterium]|nr:mucoidy inhibitor MuiA family protein [Leptospiraceae bacterium]HMX32229.1 mucoidy inhibitor MuiA family protein [Leptospiraceae bacterium]HMY33045.1 mucoidy inhibitor MuiA family protein [Leptospiraceae bacterium]HMZ63497.1 mucoidy inhibitor MuiA family protein [Leptospiraceae bacterium]HNA08346.1 mucoidy inhibitor MuiA family protein [Leptospiraceae bacterium]
MYKKSIFVFFILICINLLAEPISKEGKIQDVVLYRNQALVTRVIELDLKEGSHEITISKLPSELIQNSLYAEAIGAEVRAAKLKITEVKIDSDPKLAALDDKIEKLNQEFIKLSKLSEVNRLKLAFLTKQEDFTVTSEKIELNRGLLNAETIKQLTLFHFEQRRDLALEEIKIQEDIKALNRERDLLARERKQLVKTSLKSMDASIFLDKIGNGKCEIKLFYLVQNAGWSPIYNFYSKLGSKTVKVEFNARIQQITGENWENVNLTLSNATPALSALAPGLSPFRISLSTLGNSIGLDDLKSASQGISKKMSAAYNKQIGAQNWNETQEGNWAMNSAANEYQNLELVAKDEDLNVLKKDSKQNNASPSVSFNLKSKVSFSSKNEQQLVKVDKSELSAKFYNVAIPLLTSYVYREAEIENEIFENLLEGPVSVYLDEKFVGHGEISNVAKGQSFVMGFGIDTQIRARRELVEKKEKILGGNKELNFKIRMILENFSKKPTDLRVLDRIPAEDEKENVRITLDLKNSALSSDELYQQYERIRGILRWDLGLQADSSATKAKTFEYSYKLEFDKNLQVSFPTPAKADQMKTEFEEIQRMKYNRR